MDHLNASPKNPGPTTEERFWSAISHLSALAIGMGMIVPAFGWSDQRKKSKYASFQTLQALGYQTLGYTVWTIFILLIFAAGLVILVLSGALSSPRPGNGMDAIVGAGTGIFVFLMLGLYLLFPVIAAVATVFGKDFRYPLLGNLLAGYIGYDPTDPAGEIDEEKSIAFAVSMGHFCVIFPIWGLTVPLGFWAMLKDASEFLRVQSLQTIFYQVLGTVFLFLYTFAIALVSLAVILPSIFARNSGISDVQLMSAGVLLLCTFGFLLLYPLFQILGQWAGLRILQGRDYRYPFLGRIFGRWLKNKENEK